MIVELFLVRLFVIFCLSRVADWLHVSFFTAHLVYSIVWYRIVDVNSMLQLVNVAFQFMCIMSGSVET